MTCESPRLGPGAIRGGKPKRHLTGGFGLCGCAWPPRGHDPGCLWGLDEPPADVPRLWPSWAMRFRSLDEANEFCVRLHQDREFAEAMGRKYRDRMGQAA